MSASSSRRNIFESISDLTGGAISWSGLAGLTVRPEISVSIEVIRLLFKAITYDSPMLFVSLLGCTFESCYVPA